MKSFGKLVPLRILLDDRHHILGHALYRQLARPYEGRKPSIAVAIRSPVGFHLFLGKLAQHASRKCYFDKHVLVENESFSLRRAKRPKLSVAAICIVLPSARKNDRLKIGDGFDLVWIAPGAEEADRSPPVVPNQSDILRKLQPLKPRIYVAHVIDEAIRCKESNEEKVIAFNNCGHGLLDLKAYEDFQAGRLVDYEPASIQVDSYVR